MIAAAAVIGWSVTAFLLGFLVCFIGLRKGMAVMPWWLFGLNQLLWFVVVLWLRP